MRKLFLLFAITLFAAAAAAYGANYLITTQVIDAGGANGQSAHYQLIGKARGLSLAVPSSTHFIVGEGFLRTAYISYPIFAPIVTGIDPSNGNNTGTIEVTVSGANFASGASVKLTLSGQPDITATNVTVVNSGKITCTFDLTGAVLGVWSVTVTNTDGKSGTLPSAFRITALAPVVTAITPNKGDNTGTVNITNLAGNYFRAGAAVKLSKSGENDIIADNVTVESDTKITCSFDLTQKTVGFWDVTVTNTDSQFGTLLNGFEIQSPSFKVTVPVISEKNPFDPGTGPTNLKYTLSQDHEIMIFIFDIRGQKIWQYVAAAGAVGGKAGVNEVPWDGMTAFRSSASNGVYLVRVVAKVGGSLKVVSSTKIALIRQ